MAALAGDVVEQLVFPSAGRPGQGRTIAPISATVASRSTVAVSTTSRPGTVRPVARGPRRSPDQIGLVLNADALLAGRRFGGQSARMAGGDAVGAPRCGGGIEHVVEAGLAGVAELVG